MFIVNRSSEKIYARSASNIRAADILLFQLKLERVCKCVAVFTHFAAGHSVGVAFSCLQDCLMMAAPVTCRNVKQTY